MTKTKLARSTSRHRAPSRRDITKPAIFDLYEQVREIVSPLELELRYTELDELVSQLGLRRSPRSRSWIHGCRLGGCRTIFPPRPRRAVLTRKIPAAWVRWERDTSTQRRLPRARCRFMGLTELGIGVKLCELWG
jgi:hypothetical protein